VVCIHVSVVAFRFVVLLHVVKDAELHNQLSLFCCCTFLLDFL
jgi:hypothetical protein